MRRDYWQCWTRRSSTAYFEHGGDSRYVWGDTRRPITDLGDKVLRPKRELAEARMECEILKKPPRTLPGLSCPVCSHDDAGSRPHSSIP